MSCTISEWQLSMMLALGPTACLSATQGRKPVSESSTYNDCAMTHFLAISLSIQAATRGGSRGLK